jgi:YVTN family beta-propeller protein
VTATIPVGTYISPLEVAVNPKTNTAYVTNSHGDTVSVISGRTNTVTATIPVHYYPFGIATDPKTNTAYVAGNFSSTVVVLAPCPR